MSWGTPISYYEFPNEELSGPSIVDLEAQIAAGDRTGIVMMKLIELRRKEEAYHKRAYNKLAAGDSLGAISDYSRVLDINPKNYLTYYFRGSAKLDAGDNRGAIADYCQVIAMHPEMHQAYNNRGYIKFASGDIKGAIADYNKALAIYPRYAHAYNNRGNAKSALGDPEGANDDYKNALDVNPSFADFWFAGSPNHLPEFFEIDGFCEHVRRSDKGYVCVLCR